MGTFSANRVDLLCRYGQPSDADHPAWLKAFFSDKLCRPVQCRSSLCANRLSIDDLLPLRLDCPGNESRRTALEPIPHIAQKRNQLQIVTNSKRNNCSIRPARKPVLSVMPEGKPLETQFEIWRGFINRFRIWRNVGVGCGDKILLTAD